MIVNMEGRSMVNLKKKDAKAVGITWEDCYEKLIQELGRVLQEVD